jgi:putative transcriptional regulator
MKTCSPLLNHVREFRKKKESMTQSELGDAVGVTRQTVAAIEQGRYSPSLETAFRIARIFQADLEDVFEWEE